MPTVVGREVGATGFGLMSMLNMHARENYQADNSIRPYLARQCDAARSGVCCIECCSRDGSQLLEWWSDLRDRQLQFASSPPRLLHAVPRSCKRCHLEYQGRSDFPKDSRWLRGVCTQVCRGLHCNSAANPEENRHFPVCKSGSKHAN